MRTTTDLRRTTLQHQHAWSLMSASMCKAAAEIILFTATMETMRLIESLDRATATLGSKKPAANS